MNGKKRAGKRNLTSLLIDPFKQVRFGAYMAALYSLFLLVVGYLIFAAFSEQYQHVMELFSVASPDDRWEFIANDVFYKNALRIGGFFLFSTVTVFVVIFKLTHSYYGPIISIRRFVQDLENGHYSSRVSVRKKDQLQDLASELNNLAETLEKRHGSDNSNDQPE